MNDVTAIIVNFNAGDHLRRCLVSLPPGTPAIVVDNASRDGSVATIGDLPDVTVIANADNRGFGAAVNQAARTTRAPLLWILNPDCIVTPDALAKLRAVLDAYPDCAIAAPQLLNDDGSIQASARGEPDAWTGLFGRHSLLTKFFPNSAMARKNLRAADLVKTTSESAVIDWVMGAAMLVRHDRFDEVGGFDEGYFLYWEDADLCRRLRNKGLSIRYVPSCAVGHSVGVSSRGVRTLAITAFHQSAYTYYATHVARTAAGRGFAWTLLKLRCRLKLLGGADDQRS
jgi:N-acetylglucosaminyl-diphospho-decaprenol L-rhamnosyltransferase